VSSGVEPQPQPPQQWFEEDPGRRELELRHVQELDRDATDEVQDGHLQINTKALYRDKNVPVTIEFPADFPFVPPTLRGPAGLIERHQNPLHGNFCLINNEEHWWRPDYTASLLLEELQLLLQASEAGDVAAGEAPLPEPLSGHISKRKEMVVLVFDEVMSLDLAAESGTFTLERKNDHQWVLSELRTEDGEVLAALPDELRAWLKVGGDGRVDGRWTSLPTPSPVTGAADIHEAARAAMHDAVTSPPSRVPRARRSVWSAVTFTEQGPELNRTRRNWFFYESTTGPKGGLAGPGPPIITQALSRAVRNARLKELVGLEGYRFLVVGAGAIGGQVVVELAKAGIGHIDVVDHDTYDTGNAVRHPLPISAGGLGKAEQLAALARQFNPFTRVDSHPVRFGESTEARVLADELVQAADLVIDATGLHSVTRLLHRRTAEAGKLGLLSAALSVGGYGGRVLVLRGTTPCFDCFLADKAIPRPAEGEPDVTTPYGCSHPTASCAGFDALELAANTARTAMRLVPGIAYPALDFDWAVINFRPEFDRCTQGQLTAQPDCPWCSS